MGSGCSCCGLKEDGNSSSWKLMLTAKSARNKYLTDESIPDDASEEELEFRALLDDAIAFSHF